jgi:hypothetical protein
VTTPLDPLIYEHAMLEEKEAYEEWARERIRTSLADPRPCSTGEEVFERLFARLEAKSAERSKGK